MSHRTSTCESTVHGHRGPVVYTDLTGSDPCPATDRRVAFEDGMKALYEAMGRLAVARNAFASLESDDPARWLDDDCYARWLDLRRMLIKIEDGEV